MTKILLVIVLLIALIPLSSRAADPLQKAAVFGDAEARFKLGSMYYHGDGGMPKDSEKAFKWLTKASEQGHEMATLILATMYLDGEGVEQDAVRSYRLIHAAAWKGLPSAQAILGLYYCDGIGVDKDLSQCAAWYDMAAAQGVEEAKGELMAILETMTPGQIAKATELSKKFWLEIVEKRLE